MSFFNEKNDIEGA